MPLDIGSVTTQKIYVKLVKHTNPATWQSQFSTDNTNWHTDPIKWEPVQGSGDLTITFVLGSNVAELDGATGTLTLGSVNNGEQIGTVTPASATDNFSVKDNKGNKHDPAIVVKPI